MTQEDRDARLQQEFSFENQMRQHQSTMPSLAPRQRLTLATGLGLKAEADAKRARVQAAENFMVMIVV